MTEQRFDIVVQDKVDPAIKAGLDGIGASAKATFAELQKMNTQLGRGAASAASQAQAAATATAATTAKQGAATAAAAIQAARLDDAQTKAALSAARLATAQAQTALVQQRVATETARTAEAQSKANIAYLAEESALNKAVEAEGRAIASKEKLAQATATAAAASSGSAGSGITVIPGSQTCNDPSRMPGSGYVPGAAAAAAIAEEEAALAAAARGAGTATAQVAADVTEMEAKSTSAFQRFRASATAAFDSMRDFATGGGTRFRTQANELGTGAEQAGGRLGGMGAKAGMTALSIRELLVVAREGGRGDFNRMAGSLSILAMSLDVLVPALTIAGTGFLAFYAARKSFNDEAEQQHLKDYANNLGLTSKEMRKLSDTTLDAKGNLKTINEEQVTYGDVFKGLITTIEDGFKRWKEASSATAVNWSADFKEAAHIILDIYNGVVAAIIAGGQFIRDEFKANMEVLSGHPVQGTIDGIKAVGAIASNTAKDFKSLEASQKSFTSSWDKNTNTAAEQRLTADADAIKNNRGPGRKPPKGWDRAQNIANDNGELDAQTKNLDLYGDALERANKLDEISKKYRDHNVPLSPAEAAGFAAKIKAFDDGKRVQEAMTAADEQANGPARKYADTQDALGKLFAQNAITAGEYHAQMNVATRTYEDAIDPLNALNRALQHNGELMGLYGKDRDVAAYIQQLQTAAEAKGQSIYKPGTGKVGADGITVTGRSRQLTDQAQGMVDTYKEQQGQEERTKAFQTIDPKEKKNDPSSPAYIIDNYKKMYADISKLRDGDTKDEAKAAEMKKNLDKAYLDARLSNASTVLGNLSSLSQSKNKEVAAFGKAAAVAQATIDGYLAVQKALSSPPGPPWSYAIAASVGVMSAVNVAKIAGIGFMSGGYTGDAPTTSAVGPVHGQEYVFDAAAVKRIGVPALDAMRKGSNLSQPSATGGGMGGSKVSIYPQPGVYMEEVSTSDDHIEMIAHRAVKEKAPQAVADHINKSPNTPVSKAISTQYGVRRQR